MKGLNTFLKTVEIIAYSADGIERILKLGKANSLHSVDPISGKSIPGASIVESVNVLGVANVALGIANLGVGLWNAYKIHKLDNKVGQEHAQTRQQIRQVHRALSQGFQAVQTVLKEQSTMLASVLAVQARHEEKLEYIMHQIDHGFQTVIAGLLQVTEERRRDEFLQRAEGLLKARERLLESLCFDEEVSEGERNRLIIRAEDLESWVKTRLSDPNLPIHARQPYVISKIDAMVTQQDVLLFERGEKAIPRVLHNYDKMVKIVDDEVELLHKDATPWDILTTLRGTIARYALLKRSLLTAIENFDKAESVEVLTIAAWDDGLPEHTLLAFDEDGRHLLSAQTQTSIELKTINDYNWYIQAFQQDAETFDVHSVAKVSTQQLLGSLGSKEVTPVSLDGLRSVVLPGIWEEYNHVIEGEFGFNPELKLTKVEVTPKERRPISQSRDHRKKGQWWTNRYRFYCDGDEQVIFFHKNSGRAELLAKDRRFKAKVSSLSKNSYEINGFKPVRRVLLPDYIEISESSTERVTFKIRYPGTFREETYQGVRDD